MDVVFWSATRRLKYDNKARFEGWERRLRDDDQDPAKSLQWKQILQELVEGTELMQRDAALLTLQSARRQLQLKWEDEDDNRILRLARNDRQLPAIIATDGGYVEETISLPNNAAAVVLCLYDGKHNFWI